MFRQLGRLIDKRPWLVISIVLLIINFVFLTLAFLFLTYDLLTLKTDEKEKSGERSLPKLCSRGFGFSLLAFLMLVFASFTFA